MTLNMMILSNLNELARYIAISYSVLEVLQLSLFIFYLMFLYTTPEVVGVPPDTPEVKIRRLKCFGCLRIIQSGFSFCVAIGLLCSIIHQMCDTYAIFLYLVLVNVSYVGLHFLYYIVAAIYQKDKQGVKRNILQILFVTPICALCLYVVVRHEDQLCNRA